MRWCGGGREGGIILLIPAPVPVPVYYFHYSAAVPPHLRGLAGEFAPHTETFDRIDYRKNIEGLNIKISVALSLTTFDIDCGNQMNLIETRSYSLSKSNISQTSKSRCWEFSLVHILPKLSFYNEARPFLS